MSTNAQQFPSPPDLGGARSYPQADKVGECAPRKVMLILQFSLTCHCGTSPVYLAEPQTETTAFTSFLCQLDGSMGFTGDRVGISAMCYY